MSENIEMGYVLTAGMQATGMLIKGSGKAVEGLMKLLQWAAKRARTGNLAPGEYEDLKKFLRQSEGNVTYWNIPAENKQYIDQVKSDLNKMKISYHMLPDLNTGDGMIQLLIPKEYQNLVAPWLESYCTKRLQEGNLLGQGTLTALAGGDAKTGLITIPTEDEKLIAEMERDLKAMRVSYHLMPDTNVGDGKREVLYAKQDEAKVRQWLENFCQKHIVRGGELSAKELQNLAGNKNQVGFINIPLKTGVEQLRQMRQEFEMMGINYHLMEDMRTGDGLLQIMYLKKDEAAVHNWYGNYAADQLIRGGEHSYKELANLTNGKTGMVNMPVNGEGLAEMKADFESLHINYTVMPQLKANADASIVMYASADAQRVRSWYALYQERILKETGEMLPALESVSMEQYVNGAQISAEEYQKTEDPVKTAEVEAKVKALQSQEIIKKKIPLEQDPNYIRLDSSPDYEKITINEKMVSAEVSKDGYFISRIPHKKDEYFVTSNSLVFEGDFEPGTDSNKTFIVFVNKNKEQLIVDRHGEHMQKMPASGLLANYSQVTRDFANQKVENRNKLSAGKVKLSK